MVHVLILIYGREWWWILNKKHQRKMQAVEIKVLSLQVSMSETDKKKCLESPKGTYNGVTQDAPKEEDRSN